MGAGKIVGEVAFFTGGPRHADVLGSESGFLALILVPNLLALLRDAPTTGVKLIRALGACSIYHLTHNVRETLRVTDRSYIVNDGKMLAEGPPQQLVRDELVKKTYLGSSFRGDEFDR